MSNCLNLRHLFEKSIGKIVIFLLFSCAINAQEVTELKLWHLSPYAQNITRAPAHFTPDDEIQPLPVEQKIWLEYVMVPDSSGVMNRMQADMNRWQEDERYVEQWDIKPYGPYVTPDADGKKRFLNRNFVKYLDKRLSGEIKSAQKGSTLANIGQARRALKPTTSVAFSESVRMKFKARPIRGKAYILVYNPFMDARATVSGSGRTEINMNGKIKEIDVTANINYYLDRNEWVTMFDRPLTQTINARLSSTQNERYMAFSKYSDTRFELMYSYSF